MHFVIWWIKFKKRITSIFGSPKLNYLQLETFEDIHFDEMQVLEMDEID